jgi:hypothetical protein
VVKLDFDGSSMHHLRIDASMDPSIDTSSFSDHR